MWKRTLSATTLFSLDLRKNIEVIMQYSSHVALSSYTDSEQGHYTENSEPTGGTLMTLTRLRTQTVPGYLLLFWIVMRT